jgi:hypothetical protein
LTLLGTLQADLEALLKAAFPTLDVQAFPDNPRAYKATHRVATLLIGYSGSRYSPALDIGQMVQERVTRWDISILAKSLNGEGGAVDLVEAVRVALSGKRAGGGEIRLREDRFRGRDASVWEYSVSLEIPVLAIPDTGEETAPVLTQIAAFDSQGDPAGSVPPLTP